MAFETNITMNHVNKCKSGSMEIVRRVEEFGPIFRFDSYVNPKAELSKAREKER